MDIATVVGIISAVTALLVGIGDNLSLFLDIPSLLIVVGGTLAALLVSFPLQEVVQAPQCVRYAFFPPRPDGENRDLEKLLEQGVFFLSRSKTYAQATGWVGVLLGAVIILAHLDDPKKIGPGVAICLLTALYGTVLGYLVCLPLQTKLMRRLAELRGE